MSNDCYNCRIADTCPHEDYETESSCADWQPNRAEIVAKMRRCAERMLAHVADMEAGKTGQGLAYFDPDTYREALVDLAKIDHTNGY